MLNIILSYIVYIPAAILCILPVKQKQRFGIRNTVLIILVTFSIMIPLAAYLTWKLGLRENDLLIPVFILSFLVYHFSLKLPLIKELSVFSVVVALLSILTNYAACFDASINSDSGLGTYNLEFSLFQIGITCIAIALLAYPFAVYGSFMIDQTSSPIVWNGVFLFSFTIVLTNLAIFPIEYMVYHGMHSSHGIIVVITTQFVIWLLMLVILYNSIASTTAIRKFEEQSRLWSMRESQFQSQQKYIRASEKTRHDFRHSIMTLVELYNTGDYDGLGKYLNQYVESMPKNEVISYCKNAPLNALLNYYSHIASLNQISLTMRISIPDELPVSDVDLCSMAGNILENAVIACQKAEEKKIQITIITEDDRQLYIVAVNSFNGIVRTRDGAYQSSDRRRTGIGLPSITAIAESYGGEAQFSHEGNQFFSNVVIPI